MFKYLKNHFPSFLKNPLNKIRNELRWSKQFNEIIKYYDSKIAIQADEKIVIEYLKEIGKMVVFPYKSFNFCNDVFILINYDSALSMYYVLHNKHKLYFKKGLLESEVKGIYLSLLNEQSSQSPHLYLTDTFKVDDGSVIADLGAAEGIFSLNIIEQASKIYLFEPDPLWVEALQHTFEPWKEKVFIINKFVGFVDDIQTVSMDEYFKNIDLDFIKADIEGSEDQMLAGAEMIFNRNGKIKMVLTTYHKQEDYNTFHALLTSKYSFSVHHSTGFMLFYITNNLRPPYLRRGVLRAEKYNT